jgi:hypothetical protein
LSCQTYIAVHPTTCTDNGKKAKRQKGKKAKRQKGKKAKRQKGKKRGLQ